MVISRKIRGILFDSGDTLVRPIGGRWWFDPYFYEILKKHGIVNLDWDRTEQAHEEGMEYLDKHHYVLTEDEEREQFRQFYEIVLRVLGLSMPTDDLIQELAGASLDKIEIEPFPETKMVLENLHRRNLRLGIVSDSWPSLERKYRKLGLRNNFDTFVISSYVGCFKPDERIFRAAIESIGLPVENLLFVDDSIENVRKAMQLGLSAVIIARNKNMNAHGIPSIDSLERVEDFLS